MSSKLNGAVKAEKKADDKLIVEAERLHTEDKLLAATELLRQVVDKTLLNPHHIQILHMGKLMEQSREEMLAPPEQSGWKKQSESHGHRDYLVYFRILENGAVKCRIDSPVEGSLYVPFLAVFNEPDLYDTWIPSWKFPFKVGVSCSNKLAQERTGQSSCSDRERFSLAFCQERANPSGLWGR